MKRRERPAGTCGSAGESRRQEGGKTRVVEARAAGCDHQVVTVIGGKGSYRRKVCSDCPWRTDSVGEFPAEAFKLSANTAYDMSDRMFSCHQSGTTKPAVCAGFLLRGADHNMMVRLKRIQGEFKDDVVEDGVDLFDNYRQMAIANGVPEGDESLKNCRD